MMDTMLRDLISFSGISEQRIELVSVNMRDVLTLVLASLEKEIQQSNASVELIGQWPNVLGHEPTLGPILVHLLANAIRFVAPDVRPVVRLSVELHGEFVRLSVEDNGIGIDPAHQEQIYTLFTQLHGGKYGGTGAGLAMVKKGIERMGGEVGVQSSLGHGSRFWISLRRSHV
jgi:signal transduction histidine kinase